MNSHFNKTTIRTSNNLKDILTTEHEAIQNFKNTIQILETTHNTLTNNKNMLYMRTFTLNYQKIEKNH